MDANGIIDNVEELAKHFGASTRTIYRWIKAGMPVLADGRFDALVITAWRRGKKGEVISAPDNIAPSTAGVNIPAPTANPADNKDFWDKENKKHQAQMRELDLRKRRGELVEANKIQDLFVARIAAVKKGLIAFERTLVPDLIICRSEREMSMVIRKAVRELLEEFSRPLPHNIVPPEPEDHD
jgi:hypothetical protein